jgi:putative NIF3 family GTP cyclohydrolase 1 type 2
VFVSGEPKLMAYNMAREYGVHGVFAGHYATEVFGPRALAAWLTRRLAIDVEFMDLDIPY